MNKLGPDFSRQIVIHRQCLVNQTAHSFSKTVKICSIPPCVRHQNICFKDSMIEPKTKWRQEINHKTLMKILGRQVYRVSREDRNKNWTHLMSKCKDRSLKKFENNFS